MKPIAVRPRRFRIEFEELPAGKARFRYEEEFGSRELAEHTLKIYERKGGMKCGVDGNRIWFEAEGRRGKLAGALAAELIFQAVEDEKDALKMIQDISGNALLGLFSVSEEEARRRVVEPPDLGSVPEDVRKMSVKEAVVGMEKAGIQSVFGGDAAIRSMRQMVKDGVIKEDDKFDEAVSKIHKWRKDKFGEEKA